MSATERSTVVKTDADRAKLIRDNSKMDSIKGEASPASMTDCMLPEIISLFRIEQGVITRNTATCAFDEIIRLKPKIIAAYPSYKVKKIREEPSNEKWRYALTVLRQILAVHGHRLHSTRRSVYNKADKCSEHLYEYRIL